MIKKMLLTSAFLLSCFTVVNSHAADKDPSLGISCFGNILTKTGSLVDPKLVWRADKRVLWRGDGRHDAQTVFANGMKSNAVSRDYTIPEREFDWSCHKESSFRSNFVSTTLDKATTLYFLNNGTGWVYEIHAPGGIDQERSIGQDNAGYEQEISFPGGIKSKFVKQGCYYEKKELVRCEDNPNYESPSWEESAEAVAASRINLATVVPKADCSNADVAAITPPSLCQLPNMAWTKTRQRMESLMKNGLEIHYDVSDRGSEKPARWILLMSGPNPEFNSVAARIPITSTMQDKGTVIVPPNQLSSPHFPVKELVQRWSLGVSHSNDSNHIDGTAAYLYTTYTISDPINANYVLPGKRGTYEIAEIWTTTEAGEEGVDVYYNNSTGEDAYLVALLEEYKPGDSPTKIGGKIKVSPIQSGHKNIQIDRKLYPNGGIFRIGLSKNADSFEEVKFLGNAPLIKVMAPGDVALVDIPTTSVERANAGFPVRYQAPDDRDVFIFTQVRGKYGWSSYGSYEKVAAGSSGKKIIPIFKAWYPQGGKFRVGLSDNVNNTGSARPLGSAPIITTVKNEDNAARSVDHPEASIKDFSVGKNYILGDKVLYKGKLYICINSHKSQSDWTPDIAVSLWEKLDPKGKEPH